MTKIELIELIRSDMIESIKTRDRSVNTTQAYGYFHGQYKAYESVIKLLTVFEIEEINVDDTRMFGCDIETQ